MSEAKFLTVAEVAAMMRVSKMTVYRLVHNGDLPAVRVRSCNLELRDRNGFIGDQANKSAFRDAIDGWRRRVREGGEDPLGDVATEDLSKKDEKTEEPAEA